jgi:hypothetical protein
VLKKEESFEYSLIEGKFDSEVYIKFMDVLAERAAQKFKETSRITVVVQRVVQQVENQQRNS